MVKKQMKSVTAVAPATIANLGPGFDCLGMAIGGLKDRVKATIVDGKKVLISSMTGKCDGITSDVKKNTAGLAVLSMLKRLKVTEGISLDIHKGIPAGSGMGSSAASAAAAVWAVSTLLGLKLSKHELIEFAMEGERASAGTPHADNVAPAVLGGVTIVRSTKPLDVVSITPSRKLKTVIVHPRMELKTKSSRAVLPKSVELSKAVDQWSNVAGLVAGLCNRDIELVGRCMEDVIIEPARKRLIPQFDLIKKTAMDCGALGCTISGGGPSVFAIVSSREDAERLTRTLAGKLTNKQPGFDIFWAGIDTNGARTLGSS